MKYTEMSDTSLVTALVKEQEKAALAKKEANAIIAELENRCVDQIEDGVTNFKRFKSSKGAITVYKKTGSLQYANILGLKKLIGKELFDSEVKTEKLVNYKAGTAFEKALKAIVFKDYDFSLSIEDVYESLGATDDQVKVLNKKLKGDIAADLCTMESVLGVGDYDTEAFLVNKIKNADLVKVYFPDADEEFLDKIRKHVFASETISYSITK